MTDALKLVQREEGKGTLHLFSRKQAERFGFCLVIFRKDACLGFISSSDIVVASDIQRKYDRIGVKDSDIILSVNLGPKPLEITDTLPTKDTLPRAYKLTLEISVNDPVKFAQRYIQESDPVALAKTAIEGYIQRCTSNQLHDDISERMLRDYAEQALRMEPNPSIGLTVKIAHKATLWMNPEHEKALKEERERQARERRIEGEGYLARLEAQQEIHKRKLETEGELDLEGLKSEAQRIQDEKEAQHKREQDERQREYERKKDVVELDHQQDITKTKVQFGLEMQMYKLLEGYKGEVYVREEAIKEAQHQALLDKYTWEKQMRQSWIAQIGEGTMPALIARVKEAIEDDKSSLRKAVNEPELQYLLDILSGTGNTDTNARAYPLSITQESSSRSSASNSNATLSTQDADDKPIDALPGIIQQKDITVEIPDLGFKLIQTTLPEKQCSKAGIAVSSKVFVIYSLNEYGTVEEKRPTVGDILVEINGMTPETILDLSHAVSSRRAGEVVSMYVLRGEVLVEVLVNNPE
jgi:hypothetical protein